MLPVLPGQARDLQDAAAQDGLVFGGHGGFFDQRDAFHIVDGADDAGRHFDAAFGDIAQLFHRADQEFS